MPIKCAALITASPWVPVLRKTPKEHFNYDYDKQNIKNMLILVEPCCTPPTSSEFPSGDSAFPSHEVAFARSQGEGGGGISNIPFLGNISKFPYKPTLPDVALTSLQRVYTPPLPNVQKNMVMCREVSSAQAEIFTSTHQPDLVSQFYPSLSITFFPLSGPFGEEKSIFPSELLGQPIPASSPAPLLFILLTNATGQHILNKPGSLADSTCKFQVAPKSMNPCNLPLPTFFSNCYRWSLAPIPKNVSLLPTLFDQVNSTAASPLAFPVLTLSLTYTQWSNPITRDLVKSYSSDVQASWIAATSSIYFNPSNPLLSTSQMNNLNRSDCHAQIKTLISTCVHGPLHSSVILKGEKALKPSCATHLILPTPPGIWFVLITFPANFALGNSNGVAAKDTNIISDYNDGKSPTTPSSSQFPPSLESTDYIPYFSGGGVHFNVASPTFWITPLRSVFRLNHQLRVNFNPQMFYLFWQQMVLARRTQHCPQIFVSVEGNAMSQFVVHVAGHAFSQVMEMPHSPKLKLFEPTLQPLKL
jgi:hypothetical protein